MKVTTNSILLLIFGIVLTTVVSILQIFFYHFYISDFESIAKISYLIDKISTTYFFPGNHPAHIFFGHPGWHQFTTFLLTSLLGKTLAILKLQSTLYLALIFMILLQLGKYLHIQWTKLLYLQLAFFTFFPFLYSAFEFYQDIPALFYSLTGLLFFYKQRTRWSVFFFIIGVLTLESHIAFPIAIILHYLYKKEYKKILPFFIPFIPLLLFFILEFFFTGKFSNAPMMSIHSSIWDYYHSTPLHKLLYQIKEHFFFYYPYFLLLLFPIARNIFFYYKFKQLPQPSILFFISLQFFIFYYFFNECPLFRDLLPLFIYIIISALKAIDDLRQYNILTPILWLYSFLITITLFQSTPPFFIDMLSISSYILFACPNLIIYLKTTRFFLLSMSTFFVLSAIPPLLGNLDPLFFLYSHAILNNSVISILHKLENKSLLIILIPIIGFSLLIALMPYMTHRKTSKYPLEIIIISLQLLLFNGYTISNHKHFFQFQTTQKQITKYLKTIKKITIYDEPEQRLFSSKLLGYITTTTVKKTNIKAHVSTYFDLSTFFCFPAKSLVSCCRECINFPFSPLELNNYHFKLIKTFTPPGRPFNALRVFSHIPLPP